MLRKCSRMWMMMISVYCMTCQEKQRKLLAAVVAVVVVRGVIDYQGNQRKKPTQTPPPPPLINRTTTVTITAKVTSTIRQPLPLPPIHPIHPPSSPKPVVVVVVVVVVVYSPQDPLPLPHPLLLRNIGTVLVASNMQTTMSQPPSTPLRLQSRRHFDRPNLPLSYPLIPPSLLGSTNLPMFPR